MADWRFSLCPLSIGGRTETHLRQSQKQRAYPSRKPPPMSARYGGGLLTEAPYSSHLAWMTTSDTKSSQFQVSAEVKV